MNSFYTVEELQQIGFKKVGNNVLISKKASIYNPNDIKIGNNVRIDDFCILSGKIYLGDFIHISAYSALFAGDIGIEMQNYSGISSRCAVYAISDDYSGDFLTNSMAPGELRNVIPGKVIFEKYTILGSGSTILPGVTLSEGTAIGAMSLVTHSTEPWSLYYGIPCRKKKNRSKKLLDLI